MSSFYEEVVKKTAQEMTKNNGWKSWFLPVLTPKNPFKSKAYEVVNNSRLELQDKVFKESRNESFEEAVSRLNLNEEDIKTTFNKLSLRKDLSLCVFAISIVMFSLYFLDVFIKGGFSNYFGAIGWLNFSLLMLAIVFKVSFRQEQTRARELFSVSDYFKKGKYKNLFSIGDRM